MPDKALSFWLAFSQRDETCSSKLNLEYVAIESVTSGVGLLPLYVKQYVRGDLILDGYSTNFYLQFNKLYKFYDFCYWWYYLVEYTYYFHMCKKS